ncbi:uncharacterized protein LOC144544729 isoform X1 [Carex rostrata]
MTLIALVSISLVLFSFTIKSTTQAQCLPDQHEALIQLKQGFNTIELHSWNASTDCCIWDGITCDEKTGMVTAVNLTDRRISGKLNPALFNLSSLRYLNLARNQFTNHIIPQPGFERLTNLTHIDLSYSGFAGQVPIGFSALTNLISLKLSDFSSTNTSIFTLYLHDPSLKTLLSNITKLQVLRLDRVNISQYGSEWGNSVLQVGSTLQELSLADCGLRGNFLDEIFHLTRLEYLNLKSNILTGTMPPCLLVDAQLEVLDLKGNKLSGPLSRNICQGCKFRTIDLSRNRINGSLPQSLVKCNTLEILDLGNNQIVDRFPSWLGNLENLTVLVLRSNQLYGTISTMEAKTNKNNSLFSTLKVLDLSSNRFQGIIPKILTQNLKAMVTNSDTITFQFEGTAYYQNSITVISKGQEIGIKNSLRILSSLDLSQNEFSGEIPKEIWQLNSLHVLNLSHNALTGQIPSQFGSFEQLESMDISSLDLSSNHLSGPIPEVLGYLPLLSSLNVSYNYLVGQVPPFGHFSTFSNASYLGNPGLCGSPLSTQCVVAPLSRGMNQVLSSKSSTGIIGLSVSIVLGFGAGFVSVIWAMISWENGSKRFNFIIDRFYFRHFTVITDAYM